MSNFLAKEEGGGGDGEGVWRSAHSYIYNPRFPNAPLFPSQRWEWTTMVLWKSIAMLVKMMKPPGGTGTASCWTATTTTWESRGAPCTHLSSGAWKTSILASLSFTFSGKWNERILGSTRAGIFNFISHDLHFSRVVFLKISRYFSRLYALNVAGRQTPLENNLPTSTSLVRDLFFSCITSYHVMEIWKAANDYLTGQSSEGLFVTYDMTIWTVSNYDHLIVLTFQLFERIATIWYDYDYDFPQIWAFWKDCNHLL